LFFQTTRLRPTPETPLHAPYFATSRPRFRATQKTAVERGVDTNGPGSQTDGKSEPLAHEAKTVPRLYPD
jgi:hypothetical protein